jgi:hypothetical protein
MSFKDSERTRLWKSLTPEEQEDTRNDKMVEEQTKIWQSLTPEEKAFATSILKKQRDILWSEENDKYLSSLPKNIKAILWFLLNDYI